FTQTASGSRRCVWRANKRNKGLPEPNRAALLSHIKCAVHSSSVHRTGDSLLRGNPNPVLALPGIGWLWGSCVPRAPFRVLAAVEAVVAAGAAGRVGRPCGRDCASRRAG